MSKNVRIVKSVGIYKNRHPNLYKAIVDGDNVTSKEFPSVSQFIADAAEEKLANRNSDNVTNNDLLDQIGALRDLVNEIKHYAPNKDEVDNRLDSAKNLMKVRRRRPT